MDRDTFFGFVGRSVRLCVRLLVVVVIVVVVFVVVSGHKRKLSQPLAGIVSGILLNYARLPL